MKANAKYTAIEILQKAKIKDIDKRLGKQKCTIGGVRGIVSPDKIISVPRKTKNLEVRLGEETVIIELEKGDKQQLISKTVHGIKEVTGKELTKNFETNQEKKESDKKE